jgi:hypothetical protein
MPLIFAPGIVLLCIVIVTVCSHQLKYFSDFCILKITVLCGVMNDKQDKMKRFS